ncbi:hypothetical protein GQ457_12G013990 [Hibiscus cannabinus]
MIKRYFWKLFVLFRFYARNDQPGRIKSQQYCGVVLKATQISKAQKSSRQNIGPDFPAPPRKSAKAGPVVSSRDIPFVIQPKQIIEAPR